MAMKDQKGEKARFLLLPIIVSSALNKNMFLLETVIEGCMPQFSKSAFTPSLYNYI